MSLRDYTPPSRTIPLGKGNKLAVRAFGFEDIQSLLINRSGLIVQALDLFGEHGMNAASASDEEVRSFALQLVAKVPDLVAEVIALAADEADQVDNARRLPAPVQLEALIAVYELTFSEPDSVGKFFGHLTDLMTLIPKSAKTVAEHAMGSPILAGSNASGEMSPT